MGWNNNGCGGFGSWWIIIIIIILLFCCGGFGGFGGYGCNEREWLFKQLLSFYLKTKYFLQSISNLFFFGSFFFRFFALGIFKFYYFIILCFF